MKFFILFIISVVSLNSLFSEIKPFENVSIRKKSLRVRDKGNYLEYFKRKQHYRLGINFKEDYLQYAKVLNSDGDLIKYLSDHFIKDGFIIQIGVLYTRALNFIATLNPGRTIYGLDSFKGLVEKWDMHPDVDIKKDKFVTKHFPIVILKNVIIYDKWSNSFIEDFKKEKLKEDPISFLYLNCFTYQMTKDMLYNFQGNFKDGTIILFNAFFNYNNRYQYHRGLQNQNKAFFEFANENKLKYEFFAYNNYDMQLAIKIIKK